MSENDRRILLVQHDRRPERVRTLATELTRHLNDSGIEVVREEDDPGAGAYELVVVLGGDGTILRGAEHARRIDVPLLGVNLGHVGFLAEAEPEALPEIVTSIVEGAFTVEERMTLELTVRTPDGGVYRDWALNEIAINKGSTAGMVDATVSVDDRGLSSFGADGVLLATPTGSTAYAFSAGGPVVWPDVEAMLVVPIAAHALFSRPLVISPTSTVAVTIATRDDDPSDVWCDGRRRLPAPTGTLVEARRGERPLRLARISPAPFSGRLVAKFRLPVSGWRDSGQ